MFYVLFQNIFSITICQIIISDNIFKEIELGQKQSMISH